MMTTDTQIRTPFRQLMRVGAAAVLALGLAACGGSSSKPDPDPNGGTPPTVESAYDKALKAINMADTPEAVEAELDKAEANILILAPESKKLRQAAEARKTVLATMVRRTAQKKALSDAADNVDTSDLSDAAKITAAKAAIAKLQEALDDAGDVSDTDKATYQTQLAAAQTAVDKREQMNALSAASGKLDMALAAFAGVTPTKAQLDAAMAALRELKAALTGAEDLTDDEKDRYQAQADRADADDGQIKTAQGHYHDHVVQNIEDTQIAAAETAVAMVTDTSGDDTVTAAQTKIDAAKAEIEGANITEAQKAKLRSKISMHEGALERAKKSRTRYAENQERIDGVVEDITDGEIKAVMDAIGKITSLSEESTVTDVEKAIAAAKKAIADADIPEANKELLRTHGEFVLMFAAVSERSMKVRALCVGDQGGGWTLDGAGIVPPYRGPAGAREPESGSCGHERPYPARAEGGRAEDGWERGRRGQPGAGAGAALSVILSQSSSRLGFLARVRMVSATASPRALMRPMAKRRSRVMFSGPWPERIRLRSSSKLQSRMWWVASMVQCPRWRASRRCGGAAPEVRLVMP